MTILLRPLINEKSMGLTKMGFFTFEIAKTANKSHVQKVVTDKFGVHVLSVKIVNTKGKEKLQPSRKGYFLRPGTKKAIVQLKKGEKIALFEVAKPDEDEVIVTTADGEKVANVKGPDSAKATPGKERKGLFGPKVKIEKMDESVKDSKENKEHPTGKMHTQQGGKTKGEK